MVRNMIWVEEPAFFVVFNIKVRITNKFLNESFSRLSEALLLNKILNLLF